MPLALIGQALMPILFGEVAHRLRSAPATALRCYDRALLGLSITGCASLVALSLSVNALAAPVLGDQWAGVGPMLLLLTPFMIGQFAVSPLSQTLSAAGRNREQLVWDACRLIAACAALLPVSTGWIGLHTGVGLFSVAMVVAYLAHVLLARAALRGASAPVPTRRLAAEA
jgi:O-antigen/teichoic acid export membrane protein